MMFGLKPHILNQKVSIESNQEINNLSLFNWQEMHYTQIGKTHGSLLSVDQTKKNFPFLSPIAYYLLKSNAY